MRTKRFYFPLLFLLSPYVFGQDLLTELEKKYLDDENDKSIPIKGRVNRNSNPGFSNSYVIDYDFKSGIYNRNNIKLKVNTPVIFRISNINRLAYNVKITAKDSAVAVSMGIPEENAIKKSVGINSEKSSTIDNMFHKIDEMSENKINAFFKNSSENLIRIKELTNNNALLSKELPVLDIKLNFLKNSKSVLLDNLEIIKNNNATINTYTGTNITEHKNLLLEKLTETDEEILSLLTKKDSILASISSNFEEIKKLTDYQDKVFVEFDKKKMDFQNSYHEYSLYARQIQSRLSKYQQTLVTVINDPYLDFSKFKTFKILHKTDEIKLGLLSLFNDLRELESLYVQAKDQYDIVKNVNLNGYLEPNDLTILYAPLDAQKNYMDAKKKDIDDQKLETTVGALLHSLDLLEDESNYNIMSSPVQPTQDLAAFEISITHKNKNEDIDNSKNFKHREFTYGGIRLDAGLGFAITYMNNTPQYELIEKYNSHIIALDRKNYYSSSLMLLFTATYRSASYVALGASAGIGVNLGENDSALQFNNYYLGPTAMFGKTNRFALTVGFAIKQVEKLKAGYNLDDAVASKDTVFTNKTFRFGPFLSITYNLTQGVKDNLKFVRSFF